MKKFPVIAAALLVLILGQSLAAQEKKSPEKKGRELFYTYIGPLASLGHSHAWYQEWIGASLNHGLMSGLNISGGVNLSVFVRNLSGTITIQYIYNWYDAYPIQHLVYKASGKYLFTINEIFSIGVGAGVYFESPPSDRNYQGGAGALVPVQFAITTSSDTRLLIDLYATFGWFGIGYESVKLGYGIDIAFVFKVGHI